MMFEFSAANTIGGRDCFKIVARNQEEALLKLFRRHYNDSDNYSYIKTEDGFVTEYSPITQIIQYL